jgi:hypothetical protein
VKRRIAALACIILGFGLAIEGIRRSPPGPLSAPTMLWYLGGSACILAGYVIFAFAALPPSGDRERDP